ncbi:hypothetical protein HPB50_026897 [Hyalomma asiaticum]|uniref:Uncharacterized protein n=1 Tax=Hyalomma asiaticum TaxID=266040 RepID=A0ACB7RX67_HYAAI|nr:hypothetical protein HPB50_026897 [Hyalomma asiaticum]
MVLYQQLTEASQLPTPGRSDMHNREAVNRSPMSTATQCASKLQALLAGHRNAPSDELRAVLRKFSHTLEASILETVSSMSGTFCTAYVQNLPEPQGSSTDVDLARRQLQLGETLFYKALESIIIEMKQLKPDADLSVYLGNSAFQQSLFACCLEIVMYCYNSQREFPWILELFDVKPYNFYKIIEPLIRAEKGLWREVIKHLNQIEEQILECHAWKDGSPLWDVIYRPQQTVPQCKEVFPQWRIETFQESVENGETGTNSSLVHLSPGGSGDNQGHHVSDETGLQGSHTGSCESKSAAQTSSALSSPEVAGDNRPPRSDSLALYFRKVTKFQTNFETILNRYREQSHKKSRVYRSVYLGHMAGQEERGDIIKFYNYNDIICLTPLPRAKYMLNSPKRQVSPNVKLYVSSLKANHFATPERHTYCFNQSPAKDLLRINETVRACGDLARKRISDLLDSDTLEDKPSSKKLGLYKRVEAFVRDHEDVKEVVSSSEKPVSLTSATSKLMGPIALARLSWIAGVENILPEQQTSFRRRCCTVDSIADVVSTLEEARSSSCCWTSSVLSAACHTWP